jgi:hypothetical protein
MSVFMRWYGDDVKKKINQAQIKALRDSVEHLLTEANKTNPYREGTLERSGSTDVDESSLQGSVYYDTPYAIRMHEEPGLKYTDPKARWKWLEMTVKEQTDRVVEYIRKHLEDAHR